MGKAGGDGWRGPRHRNVQPIIYAIAKSPTIDLGPGYNGPVLANGHALNCPGCAGGRTRPGGRLGVRSAAPLPPARSVAPARRDRAL